ncbi:MAG: phospholipase D-like domain-containing protein, partial [Polaribacter sp.]|uniref:phospholipase D-like domain-containing protein n=1 Tax=Polaribacter sp. TaxID=1920175 RepID=UPI003BAFE9BE
MALEFERSRYFWLGQNDIVTPTEPEPPTAENSRVTPLFDMWEYRDALQFAFAEATGPGDFIYIANWWLGLRGGDVIVPETVNKLNQGPTVSNRNPFPLDPVTGGDHLIDLLAAKAASGVDVRVMGWISWAANRPNPVPLLGAQRSRQVRASLNAVPDIGGMISLNAETMDAVQFLRNQPNMAKSCILNSLSHTAGAVHIKGAVIGSADPNSPGDFSAVAFTGGLDFQMIRWAQYGHENRPTWTADTDIQSNFWHDMQAMIDGPAAQAFYDHFKEMWRESLLRQPQVYRLNNANLPDWVAKTPNVPTRTITGNFIQQPAPPPTHHVQSARTIPAFNYHPGNIFPEGTAYSKATNGLFEVRACWRKAISGAQRYIYMEDQGYYSREVMEWVNDAIRAQPDLRVILMMSGAGDPNDAPRDEKLILERSLNNGLLGIGTSTLLNADQRNQIRIFQAWGDLRPNDPANDCTVLSVDTSDPAFNLVETDLTWSDSWRANEFSGRFTFARRGVNAWRIVGNPPFASGANTRFHIAKAPLPPAVGDALEMRQTAGTTVHSKVIIIDDTWASIGSANIMRRSLYTDWEYSVMFMDENPPATNAVKAFRERLWREHFKRGDPPALPNEFSDLDTALGAWAPGDPAWQTTPAVPPLPTRPAGESGPAHLEPVVVQVT